VSFLVIFLIVIGVLFAASFLTKRRFGVLGLALAAGAMLSSLWVGDLTPIIASAGFVIVKPPLSSLVSAGLILAPALVLLSSGPTYKNMRQRIVGAAAFAVLATSLLLEPLGTALVIDHIGKPVYDFFVKYHAAIVTVALVLAVLDLLVTKTPRHKAKD
jgi:hypothetical protein